MSLSRGTALLTVGIIASIAACAAAEAPADEETAGAGDSTDTVEQADPAGTDGSAEPDASSDDDAAGAGTGYSVANALAHLPRTDTQGAVTIQTAHLELASEAAGLDRPAAPDGVAEWLAPVVGQSSAGDPAPVFVPLAGLFNAPRLGDHDEFAEELGWSLADVDWFVEQATPPHTYTVVGGDFDASSLAPHLIDVGNGVHSAGEGEDHAVDIAGATVARPTGVPLRLAVSDGRIAAGPATVVIGRWAAGAMDTYADHAELTAVAAALDDANVVSAMLVTGATLSLSELPVPGDTSQLQSLLPAGPFETVGIGWSAADDAGTITVAYHFPSADDATAALPAFESVLSEGTLLSGTPVSRLLGLEDAASDGPVVTLTLSTPTHPALITDLLVSRDVPFLHQ